VTDNSFEIPESSRNVFEVADQQLQSGNIAAAKEAFEEISAKVPHTSRLKLLEARILVADGKLAEAAKAYENACNMQDASADAFTDLAKLLKSTGNNAQAREVLRIAFRKFPQTPQVAAKLALALLDEGHIEQARKLIDYSLKIGPDDLEVLETAGIYCRATGSLELAIEHFGQALQKLTLASSTKRRTLYVRLSLQLAEAHKEYGEVKSAESTLRLILKKMPESTRAWLILSDVMRFKKGSPEIKRMQQLLVNHSGQLSLSDRIDLNFALGKAWMDIGDAKQAMSHLNKANQLHRSQYSYDIEAVCRRLKNYGRTCLPVAQSNDTQAQTPDTPDLPLPIFIVGMPRSGTTLVEQILATHPKVFGAGELTTLPRLKNTVLGLDFPDAPDSKERAASKEVLSTLAKLYLQESRQHLPEGFEDNHYLIDKMPGNFMFCGLILAALPHAKIVHCRRNPIDTCLSCYSKYFVSGQSFTYDLAELGRYYRSYEKLMSHWRQKLPKEKFFEIDYEDLVADIERESKRLVEFLGLDWSEDLLAFHNTKRAVRTASSNQVRQPIYNTSLERWRPYKNELKPLFDALSIKPD
jgi:tetratricopeptide (TPR) repeat protein